jgi:predicted double-glycine peptidase
MCDLDNLTPLNLPMVAQSLDYTCGAACFDSAYQYFMGHTPGEIYFANELETLSLKFTPLMNVVNLARRYGFACEMTEGAEIADFILPLSRGDVIFVTWWDEDAGHYSLVKHLDRDYITLMDPWLARIGLDNRLTMKDFIPNWQLRGCRMIRIQYEKLHKS